MLFLWREDLKVLIWFIIFDIFQNIKYEGDNLERENLTWFGIKLTQKQATNIFILSFAGLFFLSLTMLPFLFSFIYMIINSISWGEAEYIMSSLFYTLPYFVIFICFSICCIYSLLRSRKIAKYHTDIIVPRNIESRGPLFCPNCGNRRIGIEKFCKSCGEAFK